MTKRATPEQTDEEQTYDSEELSAREAAELALRQIADLTTREPIGVTSVQPVEAGWLVEVEVVEEARIPSSADTLGLYEVELDLDGDLLSYRRTQRYARGRTDPRR